MFEAYSVAVKISLINGVTNGLMNISRSFAKAHGDATKLQRQLDLIKFKLVAGAALTGTGLFGLNLLGKTVPAAREYVHQLQQMNVAGMKQQEIAQATAAAWAATKNVPTSTATQNLAAVRELRMVFGDTADAMRNMPTVQKLQAILSNTNDGHGGRMNGESAYTVAKALEMKGAVRNPAEFTIEADMMAKAIVASGGKVNPQDFLSTFKYGRSATIGWDKSFAYTILPTLIQEMKSGGGTGGAGGPGNALMSVYDKVINGRIAQKDIPLWSQLGLIDGSKVVKTKTGSTKGLLPEAVSGWQMFQQNPYQWTQSVLMPALRAHGITDPAKQQMYLSRLGGTRTSAFMLQQMGLQGWKFARDVPLIQGAQGLKAYNTLLKNDPMMAQQALDAQWKNLLTVIGFQIMPALVSGTLKLVGALQGLTGAMRAHPTLTKALVVGFAALSAALTFGGTVLLLSAAFSGLAMAGTVLAPVFGGVVALMGGLLAASLPIIGPIALVVAGVAALGGAIFAIVKNWDASKGVWANIKGEFSGFVSFIWDKVKWLLNKIPGVHIDDGAAKPKPSPMGPGGALNWPSAVPPGPIPNLNWPDRAAGGSPFVPTAPKQKMSLQGDVHMDGHKVGRVIWRHQSDALERQSWADSGSVDPRIDLAPVGARYA